MDDYLLSVWAVLDGKLITLFILTAIDFILGVIIALVKKTFKWEYLAGYITSDILPILAWVAVVFLICIPKEFLPAEFVWPVLEVIVYTTVFLKILASILNHFAEIGILKDQLYRLGIGKIGPNG